MRNKILISKIISIIGTILIWIPIIAPIFFTLILLFIRKIFAFDFLMPMELLFLVIIGAIFLIATSIIMKYNWKTIGISFCIIISMFIIIQLIANLIGIVSGRTEITTIMYVIMITFVVIYIISLIILGISSILLVKKLFKS